MNSPDPLLGQLTLAVRESLAGLGCTVALPVHLAIWLPMMGAGACTWRMPSPHVLTRELLERDRFSAFLGGILVSGTTPDQQAALVAVLARFKGEC